MVHISQAKGNQEGTKHLDRPWQIYSVPQNPAICPVLAWQTYSMQSMNPWWQVQCLRALISMNSSITSFTPLPLWTHLSTNRTLWGYRCCRPTLVLNHSRRVQLDTLLVEWPILHQLHQFALELSENAGCSESVHPIWGCRWPVLLEICMWTGTSDNRICWECPILWFFWRECWCKSFKALYFRQLEQHMKARGW